jgi:hypothetical protein
MATGSLDANGIWQYGEDDSNPTFSALLNRLGSSTSTAVGELRLSSPIKVASAAARNAEFPSPVQGNTVFRNDLGLTETYYAAFNASTNPGGATPAGWYPEKAVQTVARNNTDTNINAGVYGGYFSNVIWSQRSSTRNIAAYNDGFTIPFTGVWKLSFQQQGAANLTIGGFTLNTTTSPASWVPLRAVGTANGLVAYNGEGDYIFNAGDRLRLFIFTNTTYLWSGRNSITEPGTMKLEFVDVVR